MTTSDPRIEDCVAYGYSILIPRPRPDWADMHGLRTLSAAKDVVRDLLPNRSDLIIVGVGLPRKYVSELLAQDTTGPVGGANAGISELVLDAVKRDQPLARAGAALGFEAIVLNGGLSCSWLCNGIDREADDKLGIKTNGFGLIERLEDADRVVQYIREDGHAEPGLWLPWLLVQY